MQAFLLTWLFIMTNFVNTARSRKAPKDAMTYDDFRRLGYLKTYSARLPISTIAKLEKLHGDLSRSHPRTWSSKQELLFDLIEDAIRIWVEDQPDKEAAHAMLQQVATRAMQRRASGFISNGEVEAM
jgi:hypothetical protein